MKRFYSCLGVSPLLLVLSLPLAAEESGFGGILDQVLSFPDDRANQGDASREEPPRRVAPVGEKRGSVPVPGSQSRNTKPSDNEALPRYNALLVGSGNGQVIVYPFDGERFHSGDIVAGGWRFEQAITGDWNRDGKMDVVSRAPDGKLLLHLMGPREFMPAQPISSPNQFRQFTHPFKSDLDADGEAELIGLQGNGDLYLYRFRGNGFEEEKRLGSGWNFTHYWVHDWNGDGSTDFMVRTPAGELILYPVRAGEFQSGQRVGNGWEFSEYLVADWDGDGGPEFMVRGADGRIIFYPFDRGEFKPGYPAATGWNFSHYFPGDWNGDGRPEVLARDSRGDLLLFSLGADYRFENGRKVGNDWQFDAYIPYWRGAK